ncbi:unnamed protein product [Owenia fusiformis]|uniref:1-phosphatidylinositol-5-phosphate 4-kinase n=1 Tax=Owenia fusiformis TaxID=6347 RepID=A0A8J1TRR1_OWEFU|nr:unnamed protein product [Owenia fusiformis]
MDKRLKKKKKHLKAVHQKVKLFRANEPLLSVFMWGINHSINGLSHVNIPVMLMPDDFKAHTRIKVENHLFNKENMPSKFKFKEYCPMVFRNLRERFEIDDQEYMNSLTVTPPTGADSPGRSGARFLASGDKRFVIKTLISEEVAEMHHILKQYHQHIVERHAKTLLPQYLGMYRVTFNDQETYMIVMRNIFSARLNVHKKYDLKGSTVQRQASDKEKAKDLPTYKDNDFVSDGIAINVGPEAKEKLLEILSADVQFMSKNNLMDYSLLVGIHDVDRAEQEFNETFDEEGISEDDDSTGSGGGAAMATSPASPGGMDMCPTPPDSPLPVNATMNLQPFDGVIDSKLEKFAISSSEGASKREIYFMALIDILTHYGVKKRTAQAAKTVKHGAGAEISTVKPEQYAKRFLDFINNSLQ